MGILGNLVHGAKEGIKNAGKWIGQHAGPLAENIKRVGGDVIKGIGHGLVVGGKAAVSGLANVTSKVADAVNSPVGALILGGLGKAASIAIPGYGAAIAGGITAGVAGLNALNIGANALNNVVNARNAGDVVRGITSAASLYQGQKRGATTMESAPVAKRARG